MTDLEALIEDIGNRSFEREPLAAAIIGYLAESDPQARKTILKKHDQIIESYVKRAIRDYKESDLED